MSDEAGAISADSSASPATDTATAVSKESGQVSGSASGDGRADTLERSSSFSRADTLERSSSFSRADTLERTSSVSEEYLRAIGNPQHIEKRFPVDRKKLERLIVAGGKDNESADDFFKRVMEETGTLVLWPSKLKIGAKSKKDPQVKVVGAPASVQKARELILMDLDAKSNRVTLKIDVPYAEHSHVIGKEGANIKRIHEETRCHIHFPDSNRGSSHGEKSNQVSITGQAVQVEMARQRIRDLLPLVVSFTLPVPGHIDPNSPDIQQMMLTYNVNIHIKPQPRHYSMLIVIRGTVKYMDGQKLAFSKIVEYFTGDYRFLPPVSLSLDIAPQHHRTLIGSGGGNIKKIMQDTETSIQFPDPQSRYHTNQVLVSGTLEAVFLARDQLLGCLPVVLMFDVHETEESYLNSSLIGELMQQLDVFISVKAKNKQPVQSVIIKSIEQNMECMYQARVKLLEYSSQPMKAVGGVSAVEGLENSALGPMRGRTSSMKLSSVPEEPLSLRKRAASVKSRVGTSAAATSANLTTQSELNTGQPSPKQVKLETEAAVPPPIPEVKVEEQQMDQKVDNEDSLQLSQRLQPSPTSPPQAGVRLTTRSFLDYDRKREEAQKAKTTKVEPNEKRYPTTKWAGNYFSESMPAPSDPHEALTSPSSAMPQGLSSINRDGFRALVRQETKAKKTASKSSSSGHSLAAVIPSVSETSGVVANQQECHADCPPETAESTVSNPTQPAHHSAYISLQSESQVGAQSLSLGEDPIGATINAAAAVQQVTDMGFSMNPSVHPIQPPLPIPGETLYPSVFPAGHIQPSLACSPFNPVPWVMIVSPPSVPTSGQPNLETQSASLERVQSQQADQGIYRGVSDISTLLERLSLEKYQSCFDDEEVDFPTFLVMTDNDLKEIGISTLGARRKLQIAISELKKLQTKQQSGSSATSAVNPTYQNLSPHAPGASRSGSLKRAGPASFSHSVRF